MTRIVQTLVLLGVVLSAGAGPAGAAVDYDCSCDPAPSGNVGTIQTKECKCTYDYTLGKLATREFRVSCTHPNAMPTDTEVCVNNRDTNTTCTITMDGTASDKTRSCTNWNAFSRDSLSLNVYCTSEYGHDNHCN